MRILGLEHATGPVVSEADLTNVVDHFILQQPLADGRTVAEVFAAEYPDLTDDDAGRGLDHRHQPR